VRRIIERQSGALEAIVCRIEQDGRHCRIA